MAAPVSGVLLLQDVAVIPAFAVLPLFTGDVYISPKIESNVRPPG